MSKFLTSTYIKELEAFRKHFEKSFSRPTTGNVHRLRVSIKKLKALNNIIWPFMGKPSNVRYLHLFDDLFKHAGRVREAQVNSRLVLAEHKECLNLYVAYQRKTAAGCQVALKSELENFNLDQVKKLESAVKTSLRKVPEDIPLQTALNYISISLNQVSRLLNSGSNDKSLHSIRKNVRRANETLGLFGENYGSLRLKDLTKGLKKIQDQIGDWHDQLVLAESVARFIEDQPSSMKLSQLEEFGKKLEQQALTTREDLFKLLEDVFPGLVRHSGLKI